MITTRRGAEVRRWLRRIVNVLVLVLATNAVVLVVAIGPPAWGVAVGASALLAWVIAICLKPAAASGPTRRARALAAGGELILLAACSATIELVVLLVVLLPRHAEFGAWPLVATAAIGLLLTGTLVLDGCLRVMTATRQLRAGQAVALLGLSWLPLAGLLPMARFRRAALAERDVALAAIARDDARHSEQICRTRYPLVLVHGIFFRDWRHFNYWGRIPAALARNGADVHYGGQQSSGSIEASAAELRDSVARVRELTGAAKVNVIAHSKGGLDCRYAISRLGLGDQVASLTTVNTPHRGTVLAGSLIALAPDRVVLAVGRRYDALFTRLGDDQPDFLAGIQGLTPAACAALNEQLPDDPRVHYQSCGSAMRGPRSAPFPLNVGHQLIRPQAGENDGLVDTGSMPWGEFLGLARGTGRPGVSHGDMIDLLRRDIPGFDVCEFYVQLVAGLARRGL